jgi:multidrug efflux pump subunit AcrB
VDGIKKLLPQLVAGLPSDIKVTIASDRTQTIRASVADVQFALLLTIALVVGVIFLFLRNLWATSICSPASAFAGEHCSVCRARFSPSTQR